MEDHEVYAAIGRIVVAFNSVEHWLARLLASKLGLKGDAYCDALSASMSFGQKLDLLCALEKEDAKLDLKERDRRIKVLHAAKKLEERRNAIVHSAYGIFSEGGSALQRRKAQTRGLKGLHVKIDSLDPVELREIEEKLLSWMLDYLDV